MTDWTIRTAPIQVGDQVAYSKQFLQSTGQYTGEAPHARGQVTGIAILGSIVLVDITWDGGINLPGRVNVKNLSRVKDGMVRDHD